MSHRSRRRRGFTLVEIMIVLGLLVLLAGAAIVVLWGQAQSGRVKLAQTLIGQVDNALQLYMNDMGHYPTEEEGGLTALITKPASLDQTIADNWKGPYLKKEPRDPWSQTLHYQLAQQGTPEAQQTPFKLWSNGPNSTDDQGANDDIKNWTDTTAGAP
jgi:general secretion pathway protein G